MLSTYYFLNVHLPDCFLIFDLKINFAESVNLLDVYGVLQNKHPNFTEEELKAEMITLYATVGFFGHLTCHVHCK